MLVIRKFANVSLLHIGEPSNFRENRHKHQKRLNELIVRFFKNPKYMSRVVQAEESKTDVGFEIGPQQQKC